MARKWMATLVVLMASVGTSLATSDIPGHVRVAYPGSEDCQQGCDFVAGGWPFRYLVDHPGISPFGSVSLSDGLLGADIIRPGALAETLLFWACIWTAAIWASRRLWRLRLK